METPAALRGLLTALFVAECVHSLGRGVLGGVLRGSLSGVRGGVRGGVLPGRGDWRRRVDHLLHLLMSVAMAAMLWGRDAFVPAAAQTVLFAAAAVWFPLCAIWLGPGRRWGAVLRSLPAAAGMGAMVWMVHGMPPRPAAGAVEGRPPAHASMGMGDAVGGPAGGAVVVGVLALFLLVCSGWSFTRGLPLGPTARGILTTAEVYDHFWAGTAALGTAVMLVLTSP